MHLLRRVWLVALFGVLAAVAAYFVTRNPPTVYRSTLTFVLQPASDVETASVPDAVRGIAQESGHLRNTIAAIVGTRSFLDAAGRETVGRPLVPDYQIFASVNPDTDILVLSLEGPDRNVLRQVGPTLAQDAAGWVESVYRAYRLTLLDTQTPKAPLPAQTNRNIALAAVLGMLLGLGLVYAEWHMRTGGGGFGSRVERRGRERRTVPRLDDVDDDDLLRDRLDLPDTLGRVPDHANAAPAPPPQAQEPGSPRRRR
jgi:capsular polysaccharide biosynthesis protein